MRLAISFLLLALLGGCQAFPGLLSPQKPIVVKPTRTANELAARCAVCRTFTAADLNNAGAVASYNVYRCATLARGMCPGD